MTALADGVQGVDKLNAPIKFIWQYAGNALINQHGDTNRTDKILRDTSKCEMIVVIDNQMTPSARYADIILPDVIQRRAGGPDPAGRGGPLGYAILASKAIEPLFESKTIYEICTGIAQRMGVEQKFTEGKDPRAVAPMARCPEPGGSTGAARLRRARRHGHLATAERARPHPGPAAELPPGPEEDPLSSPSGQDRDLLQGTLGAQPDLDTAKGRADRGAASLVRLPGGASTDPLRASTRSNASATIYKGRTHSTYGNVAWLKEAAPQIVWINPADAAERGIANDDTVYVFNGRGRIKITARVTPGSPPG